MALLASLLPATDCWTRPTIHPLSPNDCGPLPWQPTLPSRVAARGTDVFLGSAQGPLGEGNAGAASVLEAVSALDTGGRARCREQPRVAVERTGALAWKYSGLDSLNAAQAAADTRAYFPRVRRSISANFRTAADPAS